MREVQCCVEPAADLNAGVMIRSSSTLCDHQIAEQGRDSDVSGASRAIEKRIVGCQRVIEPPYRGEGDAGGMLAIADRSDTTGQHWSPSPRSRNTSWMIPM